MDFIKLMSLAGGHAEARAIQTALKLRMFEALGNGPRRIDGLAGDIGCDPRATALLANALAALGVLVKSGDEVWLSEAARRFLLERSGEYAGGMILFDEALWTTWEKLDQTIRSGRPARTPDMFQANPDDTARFIRAMDSLVRARGDGRWTAEHLDLSSVRTLADLGGGPGTYALEFLRRNPAMRAEIWDLPATLEVARTVLHEHEPSIFGRLTLREVDYNSGELPRGVDAIFMSNIIHSENELANAELFAKCFRALTPGGLVIVKDHIMNRELTAPTAGAVFSLYLILTTRGRDYSFDELAGWMTLAGFSDISVTDLPSPPFTSSIVVGVKR